MKLFSYSLLIFLLHGIPANAQLVAPDTSYNNSHYRQRLEFFRMMPDRKNEIVFLGNSITEAGDWQQLLPGKPVINRGISGDVTFGVVARMGELLSSKPKKIFLLIGINDLKRGLPDQLILRNYEKIISLIRSASPKTQLVIQSILPVNASLMAAQYHRITNARVQEINKQIKQLAAERQVTYIDLQPAFADGSGQLSKMYTTDGIHLKMPAYMVWVQYLKNRQLL